MLLISNKQRPGAQLNILECTGQASQQIITWPKLSVVLWSRKLTLETLTHLCRKNGEPVALILPYHLPPWRLIRVVKGMQRTVYKQVTGGLCGE